MQRVHERFIFMRMRAAAGLVGGDGLWISSRIPSRRCAREEHLAASAQVGEARQEVEQVRDVVADLLVAGEQPEVRVQPRGLGVVVARPDVDVVADARRPPGDDEQALGVRLERGSRRRRARRPPPARVPTGMFGVARRSGP
jgi:hypothetical protein